MGEAPPARPVAVMAEGDKDNSDDEVEVVHEALPAKRGPAHTCVCAYERALGAVRGGSLCVFAYVCACTCTSPSAPSCASTSVTKGVRLRVLSSALFVATLPLW